MAARKNLILVATHGRQFLADVFWVADNRAKPIIIFAHGFKGFKDWGAFDLMAQQFARLGFVFVKFNFSYNGTTLLHPTEFADPEAFGNNNFSIELDDLGGVIDWVGSPELPLPKSEVLLKEIYLIGHSRGGGIALLKAAEDKRINKVATWAGVNEFGKFWKAEQMEEIKRKGVIYVENSRTKQQLPVYWQLYENYFANISRLFIPDAVKKLNQPLLIVHGTQDDAVPYSSAEEMKTWQPKAELFVVENGNHVFGAQHPWPHANLPSDLEKVIAKTAAFFAQPLI